MHYSQARRLMPYVYLSPALITIAVLSVLPMLFTIYLAFTDASLYTFKDGFKWAGLSNFVEIATGGFSQVFVRVLGWNIVYALLSCLTQYSLGMFVAVLLNNPNMPESRLYRSLLIIPFAIPGTLAVMAWSGLFNTSAGAINMALFHMFGIENIPWLQNGHWARGAVLIVNLWLGFPWFMTVCLGALQSIPHDLYEAASIDGANAWNKFWGVTFPMMLRFTTPLLIGSFAHNFNNFGTAFLMTGGGPPRMGAYQDGWTDILVSVSYKLTVTQQRYALSAALSLILFLVIVAITLANMKVTGAFKEED